MEENNYNEIRSSYARTSTLEEGRMQKVLSRTFLYMFVVLILSAAAAYATASSPSIFESIFGKKNVFIALIIGELVVVFAANTTLSKNMVIPSAFLLVVYSIVNGVTLSSIFYIYELGSIFTIFILAAVLFGVMAIYGLVTKQDLTMLGRIGMMGLFAVIIISVANLVIFSKPQNVLFTAIGLALFIGLTAYDTQRIKEYADSQSDLSTNTLAMFGALILYLDFINIFLKLLRLFGKRN